MIHVKQDGGELIHESMLSAEQAKSPTPLTEASSGWTFTYMYCGYTADEGKPVLGITGVDTRLVSINEMADAYLVVDLAVECSIPEHYCIIRNRRVMIGPSNTTDMSLVEYENRVDIFETVFDINLPESPEASAGTKSSHLKLVK